MKFINLASVHQFEAALFILQDILLSFNFLLASFVINPITFLMAPPFYHVRSRALHVNSFQSCAFISDLYTKLRTPRLSVVFMSLDQLRRFIDKSNSAIHTSWRSDSKKAREDHETLSSLSPNICPLHTGFNSPPPIG